MKICLIRWNTGSDLLNLHSELDRVFEALSALLLAHIGATQTYLPLDIRRMDDHIEAQASVLGCKPEEVTVTVGAGVITITAEEQS